MTRADDLYERLVSGGATAIDALILDRRSEELFLDFKRSADNGSGSRLHQNDRNNLAKAISGFGNSEGGVIVWGVDCRDVKEVGDVAQAKVPVENPQRFVSWLEGSISGCTVPPHPDVRHAPIVQPGTNRGFVVTHIAKSYLAPHQTVAPSQFYIRAGSDFMPAPHGVLLGMFGRRSPAQIFHMWGVGPVEHSPIMGPLNSITLKLGFLLSTHGPGLVRDLFLNLFLETPGGPSEIAFSQPDSAIWEGRVIFGNRITLVSSEKFKLSPEAIVPTVSLTIKLAPPFLGDLQIVTSYGHHESPTTRLEHTASASELAAIFDALRNDPNAISREEVYRRIVGAVDSGP